MTGDELFGAHIRRCERCSDLAPCPLGAALWQSLAHAVNVSPFQYAVGKVRELIGNIGKIVDHLEREDNTR